MLQFHLMVALYGWRTFDLTLRAFPSAESMINVSCWIYPCTYFFRTLYSYSFFLDGHFGFTTSLWFTSPLHSRNITFYANTSGNGPLDGRLVCLDSR